MRVELIQHELVGPVTRIVLDHPLVKMGEVLFGSSFSDPSARRSGGDIDGGDQGLRAVAFVLEFHNHRLAW